MLAPRSFDVRLRATSFLQPHTPRFCERTRHTLTHLMLDLHAFELHRGVRFTKTEGSGLAMLVSLHLPPLKGLPPTMYVHSPAKPCLPPEETLVVIRSLLFLLYIFTSFRRQVLRRLPVSITSPCLLFASSSSLHCWWQLHLQPLLQHAEGTFRSDRSKSQDS